MYTIALSRDGRIVAVGGMDGTVALWTVATGQISMLSGGDGMVEWVGLSADGGAVIAGCRGHFVQRRPPQQLPGGRSIPPQPTPEVRLWDTATKQTRRICHGQALALHAHAAGGVLACADFATVRLWTLDGDLSGELQGHTSLVQVASFSPDGRTLATGAVAARTSGVRMLMIREVVDCDTS